MDPEELVVLAQKRVKMHRGVAEKALQAAERLLAERDEALRLANGLLSQLQRVEGELVELRDVVERYSDDARRHAGSLSRKELLAAAAAHARSCKSVGRGSGAVRSAATREKMIRQAKKREGGSDPE